MLREMEEDDDDEDERERERQRLPESKERVQLKKQLSSLLMRTPVMGLSRSISQPVTSSQSSSTAPSSPQLTITAADSPPYPYSQHDYHSASMSPMMLPRPLSSSSNPGLPPPSPNPPSARLHASNSERRQVFPPSSSSSEQHGSMMADIHLQVSRAGKRGSLRRPLQMPPGAAGVIGAGVLASRKPEVEVEKEGASGNHNVGA